MAWVRCSWLPEFRRDPVEEEFFSGKVKIITTIYLFRLVDRIHSMESSLVIFFIFPGRCRSLPVNGNWDCVFSTSRPPRVWQIEASTVSRRLDFHLEWWRLYRNREARPYLHLFAHGILESTHHSVDGRGQCVWVDSIHLDGSTDGRVHHVVAHAQACTAPDAVVVIGAGAVSVSTHVVGDHVHRHAAHSVAVAAAVAVDRRASLAAAAGAVRRVLAVEGGSTYGAHLCRYVDSITNIELFVRCTGDYFPTWL